MTTDEAKKYLIDNANYSESDFQKASEEEIHMELAKEGEWVCHYKIGYPVNEWEMKTAIELAEDYKFWNDEKNVDAYVDFMMSEENQIKN